jgi:hypothetical protein
MLHDHCLGVLMLATLCPANGEGRRLEGPFETASTLGDLGLWGERWTGLTSERNFFIDAAGLLAVRGRSAWSRSMLLYVFYMVLLLRLTWTRA